MNFFKHRYYKLNRTIMILLGQWPYQSSRSRRCFCAAVIYANTSETVSIILNMVKYRDNLRNLLNYAIPLFTNLVCATNVIAFMSNSRRTLESLNQIRADWQVWAQHEEINILHEYTEEGQRINSAFTALIYVAFLAEQMRLGFAKIADALFKNGTEPGKFPYHVEYYNIDMQKYYFYIMIYYCTMIAIIFGIVTANSIMLVSYVQHVCGIFAALGHKLTRITNSETAIGTKRNRCAKNRNDVVDLAWCIAWHNDAIIYADLIDRIYRWNIFFTIVFGMILCNLLGLQFFLNPLDADTVMQIVAFLCSVSIIFWMDCYIAQTLMDHSLDIHFLIYDNQWYRLSCRAQKVLRMMMMRCTAPCQLTAGKILILSMRTFGLTCKTYLSYLAFLHSMQDL